MKSGCIACRVLDKNNFSRIGSVIDVRNLIYRYEEFEFQILRTIENSTTLPHQGDTYL